MSSLLISGAMLNYFDVRADTSGDIFAVVHFKSNVAKALQDLLEIDTKTIPATVKSMKLDGAWNAVNFVLTPNGQELAEKHEINMKADRIDDFQLFRVKSESGDSTYLEMRFQLRVPGDKSIHDLVKYKKHIGEGVGKLKVTYSEQEPLPAAPEDTQGKLLEMENAAAGKK